MSPRLIVALDYKTLPAAYLAARQVAPSSGLLKIGSQLFTAVGPPAVKKIASVGRRLFLDLKFHDIPTTVARAVSAATALPAIEMVNVHALGGFAMMRAAVEARDRSRSHKAPKLLAVTLLTSMDRKAMHQAGIGGAPRAASLKLARLAQQAGLDGVVTSAHEAAEIRRCCGRDFLIVVPGVRPRPKGPKDGDDQARVATPAEAIFAGADYVVVGRPITEAADPALAASRIAREIEQAALSLI